jgi:hypothetical protein
VTCPLKASAFGFRGAPCPLGAKRDRKEAPIGGCRSAALISIQPGCKSKRRRSNRRPRRHQMFIFRFGQRVVGYPCSFLDEHGPDLFLSPPAPEIGATFTIDSWPFREGKEGPKHEFYRIVAIRTRSPPRREGASLRLQVRARPRTQRGHTP